MLIPHSTSTTPLRNRLRDVALSYLVTFVTTAVTWGTWHVTRVGHADGSDIQFLTGMLTAPVAVVFAPLAFLTAAVSLNATVELGVDAIRHLAKRGRRP